MNVQKSSPPDLYSVFSLLPTRRPLPLPPQRIINLPAYSFPSLVLLSTSSCHFLSIGHGRSDPAVFFVGFDETFEGEFRVFATEGLVLALLIEASFASDDGCGELEDDRLYRVGGRPAFRRQQLHADGTTVQDESKRDAGGRGGRRRREKREIKR